MIHHRIDVLHRMRIAFVPILSRMRSNAKNVERICVCIHKRDNISCFLIEDDRLVKKKKRRVHYRSIFKTVKIDQFEFSANKVKKEEIHTYTMCSASSIDHRSFSLKKRRVCVCVCVWACVWLACSLACPFFFSNTQKAVALYSFNPYTSSRNVCRRRLIDWFISLLV